MLGPFSNLKLKQLLCLHPKWIFQNFMLKTFMMLLSLPKPLGCTLPRLHWPIRKRRGVQESMGRKDPLEEWDADLSPRNSFSCRKTQLSAPKSRDSLRLQRRFVPLPQKIARLFGAPRCVISSAKKIASEPRFLLRRKWVNMILAAEFPAIPSSAVKIASERRCAILVHSETQFCLPVTLRPPILQLAF